MLRQEKLGTKLKNKVYISADHGNVDKAFEIWRKKNNQRGNTRKYLSSMFFDIISSCPRIVKPLIYWNNDINDVMSFIQSEKYAPALKFTLQLEKSLVVQQLMHSHADISLRDLLNCMILHLAFKKGYAEITQLLLHYGTEVYNITKKGNTLTAPETTYIDVFRLLMKYDESIHHYIPIRREKSLNYFIKGDNSDLLEYVLNHKTDINRQDKGYTLFHYAIKIFGENVNNKQCWDNSKLMNTNITKICPNFSRFNVAIKLLLRLGADINSKNDDGKTPLHTAIENNSCTCLIRFLLKNGANSNVKDGNEGSPLHVICSNVEKSECCSFQQSSSTDRNIIESCTNWRKINFMTQLIKYGADVNAEDLSNQTPLHVAIENKSCKCLIRFLLNSGANVNTEDQDGDTPLHKAIKSISWSENNKHCYGSQKLKIANKKSINHCKNYHHLSTAIELLMNGAEVNSKNNNQETPLHVAIFYCGCSHLIQILLDHGADINAIDRFGETPMHYAVESVGINGITHCEDLNNQETQIVDKDDVTSCPNSYMINTVVRLLKHGVKVDSKNNNGDTFLHKAVQSNCCKHLVQCLFDVEVAINSTNKYCETPLEIAAFDATEVSYEIIRLLLINGANYKSLLMCSYYTEMKDLMWTIRCFQIAKRVAGLTNYDNDFITSLVDEEQKFEANCFKEVENMKLHKLIGKITVLQFLCADKITIGNLVTKRRASTLFKMMPELQRQYPIYGQILRQNWNIGWRYGQVLKKAVDSFGIALNYRLPLVPLEMVVSYLGYDEMKALIRISKKM